jgi:AMMECR1 domain-containing protein
MVFGLAALAAVALQEKPGVLAEETYRMVEALLSGRAAPALKGEDAPKGVFVTIEIGNEVVGCRGALEPTETTLGKQIARACTEAALHDPRYGPVRLRGRAFKVTLTVIERLEPIGDARQVVPAEGLVLRAGEKVGVVLPWEGKDPMVRLEWAYKKAGVKLGAPAQLQRMVAERWRFPEK